jgi:hypothetical protein
MNGHEYNIKTKYLIAGPTQGAIVTTSTEGGSPACS